MTPDYRSTRYERDPRASAIEEGKSCDDYPDPCAVCRVPVTEMDLACSRCLAAALPPTGDDEIAYLLDDVADDLMLAACEAVGVTLDDEETHRA